MANLESFEMSVSKAELLANNLLATRTPSGDMQIDLSNALMDAALEVAMAFVENFEGIYAIQGYENYPIESLEVETKGHLDKDLLEAMYMLRAKGDGIKLMLLVPYCFARSIVDVILSRNKNQPVE